MNKEKDRVARTIKTLDDRSYVDRIPIVNMGTVTPDKGMTIDSKVGMGYFAMGRNTRQIDSDFVKL